MPDTFTYRSDYT